MTLGGAGLASLLISRGVLGSPAPLTRFTVTQEDPPPPTLGERLARELDELLAELILRTLPDLAKREMESVFEDLVIRPFNQQLGLVFPPPDLGLLHDANALLEQEKLALGEIARRAPFEIAAAGGDGVVKVLQQFSELNPALGEPTFQYPFEPEFSFAVGTPKLSTSQPIQEIVGNFLNNEHPLVDADKIKASWRAFDMNASSSFDKLGLTVDVNAEHFLNSAFELQPGQWQSHARLEWTHFQGGAINTLTVGLTGHYYFDSGLQTGPWETVVAEEFSWRF